MQILKGSFYTFFYKDNKFRVFKLPSGVPLFSLEDCCIILDIDTDISYKLNNSLYYEVNILMPETYLFDVETDAGNVESIYFVDVIGLKYLMAQSEKILDKDFEIIIENFA